MNINKFFESCKAAGIETSEASISKSSSLSISLFHGEVDGYSNSSTSKILTRGIYKGKFGTCSTEKDDRTTIPYLVEGIKETASLVENEDESIIFKGSEKYHKKFIYNKALDEWKTEDILKTLHALEDKCKNANPLVSEVQVSFTKQNFESLLTNSYGLKLKSKGNFYYFYASVLMKDKDEIKDMGDIFLSTDPNEFDIDKFVNNIVEKCLAKFHGTTIAPGTYKGVLNQDCVASLLEFLVSSLSSEEIQKHSSSLEGKLNQKVFSNKLTVYEKPLTKGPFFSYFDDEGVATYNKELIKNGVIKTYLYNLTTAKKDNTTSTGNASRQGSKIGISFSNLYLKPGKLNEDELFEKIENGVYITDITGLHAGMNEQSGDFSLQAQGFHVENGKLAEPLTLITVGGNLFKLFDSVVAVGNNEKLILSSSVTPSVAFNGLKISAE